MTDDLRLLLENIRQEARRLQADGMDEDDAWSRAVDAIIRATAEAQDLSPFEARIISELDEASRDIGGKPVQTSILADRLGVSSRFAMYGYLRKLERLGFVHRPMGRKSKAGWRVAA